MIKPMGADFQFQQDQRFDYRFLRNKIEHPTIVIADTAAATAANYGVFFIAPAAGVFEEVWETHKTAGTNGGAVTVDVEVLTSGQALDAGYVVLSTPLSLKSTANTTQRGTLSSDISKLQFARGDRFALKDAGTLTDVAHVCVTVAIRYKM